MAGCDSFGVHLSLQGPPLSGSGSRGPRGGVGGREVGRERGGGRVPGEVPLPVRNRSLRDSLWSARRAYRDSAFTQGPTASSRVTADKLFYNGIARNLPLPRGGGEARRFFSISRALHRDPGRIYFRENNFVSRASDRFSDPFIARLSRNVFSSFFFFFWQFNDLLRSVSYSFLYLCSSRDEKFQQFDFVKIVHA